MDDGFPQWLQLGEGIRADVICWATEKPGEPHRQASGIDYRAPGSTGPASASPASLTQPQMQRTRASPLVQLKATPNLDFNRRLGQGLPGHLKPNKGAEKQR